MGVIKLNDMAFYAYHGCYEEERKVGNDFIVNVAITTVTEQAEQSDNIVDALSYLDAYGIIKQEMDVPSRLLEHVARRIVDALYTAYPEQIEHLQVTVNKMNPPLGGKLASVSVTLEQ